MPEPKIWTLKLREAQTWKLQNNGHKLLLLLKVTLKIIQSSYSSLKIVVSFIALKSFSNYLNLLFRLLKKSHKNILTFSSLIYKT